MPREGKKRLFTSDKEFWPGLIILVGKLVDFRKPTSLGNLTVFVTTVKEDH